MDLVQELGMLLWVFAAYRAHQVLGRSRFSGHKVFFRKPKKCKCVQVALKHL